MSKILVVSDSHTNIANMLEAVEREKPDFIFHLGDLVEDAERLEQACPDTEVLMVRGNCDWYGAETERLVTVDGKRIFMCHGHKYGVKGGYSVLEYYARRQNADIVLFGHTHLSYYANKGGLHVMNPGSIWLPRDKCGPTYGVIDIENGEIRICIKALFDDWDEW